MGIDDSKKGEELFEYYLELRDKQARHLDLRKPYVTIDVSVIEVHSALVKAQQKRAV